MQPDPTSPLDLGALKALCDAATPGPWTATSQYPSLVLQDDDEYSVISTNLAGNSEADAAFIAAAREAIPALLIALAGAERMRREILDVFAGRLVPDGSEVGAPDRRDPDLRAYRGHLPLGHHHPVDSRRARSRSRSHRGAGMRYRYFLTEEREVTAEEFMAAERRCGFHAPEGQFATDGFGSGTTRGRVEFSLTDEPAGEHL